MGDGAYAKLCSVGRAVEACKRAQFACAYRARVNKSTQQLNFNLFFYKDSISKNKLKKQTLFYTFRVLRKKRRVVRNSCGASPKRSHNTVSVYSPATTASRKFCQLLPRPLFWEVPYHCLRLLRVANRSYVAARCAQRTTVAQKYIRVSRFPFLIVPRVSRSSSFVLRVSHFSFRPHSCPEFLASSSQRRCDTKAMT